MLCCCCCCVGNWTLRCIDGENALTEQIEMGKFSFTIIVHLQCVILDFLNVSMVLIDRLLFPETKTVPIIHNSICGLRRNSRLTLIASEMFLHFHKILIEKQLLE